MKIEEIKNLNQLAQFINANDEWKIEVNEVIEKNGWVDETGEDFGICNDGKLRLRFNSEMKAVVERMY